MTSCTSTSEHPVAEWTQAGESRATSRHLLFVFIFWTVYVSRRLAGASVCASRRAAGNMTKPLHRTISSNFKKRHQHRRHWHHLRFILAGLPEQQSAHLGAQRGRLRRHTLTTSSNLHTQHTADLNQSSTSPQPVLSMHRDLESDSRFYLEFESWQGCSVSVDTGGMAWAWWPGWLPKSSRAL